MKIPLWLIGVLFVGYSAWAVNYWHCYKCQCCDGAPPVAETTGEPLFLWNADQPVADPNFKNWKTELLDRGGQGDTMVITAWYRAGETNGAELATKRAQALLAMMAPEMPASRVKILTKAVEDKLAAGGPPLPSAGFAWSTMKLAKESGAIIESDKDVIFLFPFNSTERDRNPEVDAYLQKLCEKHKDTKATFNLVGHTDIVGSEAQNNALGLGRAKAIEKILTKNGIAQSRVTTSSKGKSEPEADNSTDEGRQKNRRVVLTVNN